MKATKGERFWLMFALMVCEGMTGPEAEAAIDKVEASDND